MTVPAPEIASCGLASGLGEARVKRLASIAESRTLNDGELLFTLGEQADVIHLVLDGEIELCCRVWLDETPGQVAIESRPRGCTAESAALFGTDRFTISARAAGPCKVARVAGSVLITELDADPGLGYAVMKSLAKELTIRYLRMRTLWIRQCAAAAGGGGPRRSHGSKMTSDG